MFYLRFFWDEGLGSFNNNKPFLLCYHHYPSMNSFHRSYNAGWFSTVVFSGLPNFVEVVWCRVINEVCFSFLLPVLKSPGLTDGTCQVWEFSYCCAIDLYFHWSTVSFENWSDIFSCLDHRAFWSLYCEFPLPFLELLERLRSLCCIISMR